MKLIERLKRVQQLAFKAIEHPLMPADARVCIAEIVLLLADLVAQSHKPYDFTDLVTRLEKLEKERNARS